MTVDLTLEPSPKRSKWRDKQTWKAEKLAWKAAEAEQKGYAIKWLYVAIAYAGELLIVAASLIGSWLFAEMYWEGNSTQFWFMMLAPITYAAVELVRVPLAIMARVQRSYVLKGLAFMGIILAAGVTTKSLSQLGEMMFHPRLLETTRARDAVEQAKAERASLDQRITDADTRVTEQTNALQALDKRAMEAVSALGALSGPKCMEVSGVGKNGKRYKSMKCASDNRNEVISAALRGTNDERPAVEKKLSEARAARDALSRDAADKKVAEAESVYRQAVLHSQLHSFTAMVYGREPTAVTDGEVHAFLRLFVFLPAVCAAFASTLLAFCAVHIPKPQAVKPDAAGNLALPAGAAEYFLGPLAAVVEQRVVQTMRTPSVAPETPVIAAAHSPAHPPLTVVTR
jgi:hypothetical protein